jgi:AraC-like DNA-binding protein
MPLTWLSVYKTYQNVSIGMSAIPTIWRHREVHAIDCGQFPLPAILAQGSVAVRETTTPHKLRTFERYPMASMLAVNEGKSHFVIEGKSLLVEAGGVLIRPPFQDFTHIGDSTMDCTVSYLSFTGPLSEQLDAIHLESDPFLYFGPSARYLNHAVVEAVSLVFENAVDMPSLLTEKLLEILRLIRAERPEIGEKRSIGQRLNMAVKRNWNRSFSTAELAALIGVSRSELYRKFKKEMGITPAAWLRQQRIALARFHLSEGLNVSEVAHLLNFSSPFALSRMFKQATGQAPKQFTTHP